MKPDTKAIPPIAERSLRRSFWQFCRFVVVGVANTGFSYLIYAMGLALGLHYAVANLVAMVTGILFSFKSQGRFVFNNRDTRLIWRFSGTWVCIWLFNIAFIALLTRQTTWDAYAAGAIALVPVTLISFVAQKYFVFSKVKDDTQKKMPPAS